MKMSVIEFEIINPNSMLKYCSNNDGGDENLNHVGGNHTNKKQSRTSNNPRSNSMLKSIGNESSTCHDNDLTNLNWLQDGDLLKKVYNNGQDNRKSLAGQQQQRRPPQYHGGSRNGGQRPQRMLKQHLQKPPFSYSTLIFMAIESSPTKSMIVSDIYKWIINHYPYFSQAPPGWKNTIRHTLSLRKCFKKIETTNRGAPPTKDPTSASDIKRGYWYVDPEYRSILQQQIVNCCVTFPGNNNHQMHRHGHRHHPHHHHHHDPETMRTSIIVDRTRTQSLKLLKKRIEKQAASSTTTTTTATTATIMNTNLAPILESYKYGNHHQHHHHHHNHRHHASSMVVANNNNNTNNLNIDRHSRTLIKVNGGGGGYFLLNPSILSSLAVDDNYNGKIVSNSGGGNGFPIAPPPPPPSPSIGNIYRNLVTVISVNQAPKLYAPVPIISVVKENDHHKHRDAGHVGGPINLSKSNNKRNNGQQQQQQQQPSTPLPLQQQAESQKPRKYFNLLKDRQNVCSNYMATGGGGLMVLPTVATTMATSTMLNNNHRDHNGNHYHVQLRQSSKFKCNHGDVDGGGGQNMFGKVSINTTNNNDNNNNSNHDIVLKNNNCSPNSISIDHHRRTLPNKNNGCRVAKVTSAVGMKTTNTSTVVTSTAATTMATVPDGKECHKDNGGDDDDDDGAQALLNFASKSFLFNI